MSERADYQVEGLFCTIQKIRDAGIFDTKRPRFMTIGYAGSDAGTEGSFLVRGYDRTKGE